MRYSTGKYVQILYEALEDKGEKEADLIISNFIKILARNKHLRHTSKIIAEFNKFYNKRNGIVEVEVISSSMLDKDFVLKIKEFYKERDKVVSVEIINILNKEMKGGVILKTDDEIIDGSVDKKLVDLRRQLLTT